MYIGEMLKNRAEMLGISINQLADKSLVDVETINKIVNNEICYDDIDEFDLDYICRVLYCSPDYFINEEIRNKDLVNSSLNRGFSDIKTNTIKGKLQQFANDFDFLISVMQEV